MTEQAWDEYWWPKILAECEEYDRIRRERHARKLTIVGASLSVLVALVFVMSAVAALSYKSDTDDYSQYQVEVPYT